MSTEGPVNDLGDITSNDRLMAALSYPIFFIISIIILLVEDMKKRPFQRYHAIQALAISVVGWIIIIILSVVGIGLCLMPIFFIVMFWPAYLAYQGKYFEVPVITKFCKDQHWM